MATVHHGRLLGPNGFTRTVAIKRLLPAFSRDRELCAMLMDEARITSRLSHPNIVSVIDVVVDGPEMLLVMDYVDGPSLSVVSMREQIGRTRRRSNVITARSVTWPSPARFDVESTRPAASFHLVTTGDAAFDARRFVTSESKAAVQAVLTPTVRAALLQCPQHTLRITCEGQQVVVSFGELVTDAKELTGAIDLALALAKGP